MIRKLALSTAAAALALAPVAAQAAPADRTPAPIVTEDEELSRRGALLPILIAIVLALIIWQVTDDGEPSSP